MRGLLLLASVFALAGCSPPPRSASELKAHPDEDSRVLAACAAGGEHGAECVNAETAAAQIKSDQRLNFYKQSF